MAGNCVRRARALPAFSHRSPLRAHGQTGGRWTGKRFPRFLVWVMKSNIATLLLYAEERRKENIDARKMYVLTSLNS